MAKKSLGYVELEWVCPTCNTRNPGSSRTCSGCGSPQPPDVKFVSPAKVEVTKDKAVARKATAGPDIHCPYCDARNPADAKVCHQCGGDLTQGVARQKGAVLDVSAKAGVVKCTRCGTENPANLTTCKSCGAPLPTVKPTVAPKTDAAGNNSCLIMGIGAVALVVIAVIVFFAFSGGGERINATGTVVDGKWVRTIQIMGLRPRQYTDWLDEIPSDAEIGSCSEEVVEEVAEPVPNSREVCGTPYAIDEGTGFGEVVQDCVYQVLADRCEYTVNEWQPVDVVTQEGTGPNPVWPPLTRTQRAGDRDEEYQCVLTYNDRTYTYRTRDFDEYANCVPGATWNIVVNESGDLISAEPAE